MRQLTPQRFTSLAVVCAAVAAVWASPAQAAAGDVCFYENINYGGISFCSGTDHASLSSTWNDRISSVKVPQGSKVTLYEHINYGGRKLELTADSASVVGLNFNDLASSLKITTAPATAAKKILFVGNSFTYGGFDPAMHYNAVNVTDLNGTGYGGVPGIFKQLTVEAGLAYDVNTSKFMAATNKQVFALLLLGRFITENPCGCFV